MITAHSVWHKLFFAALYLAAPLVALALLYQLDQPYETPESYRITSADWVVSMTNDPPTNGWKPLNETSRPQRDRSAPFTSVWFRVQIPKNVEKPALLIPYPRGNYDIRLDGERLFVPKPMRRPLHFRKRPIVVPLGTSAVATGEPLYIRVARQASYTEIRYLYIAPVDLALRDANEQLVMQYYAPIAVLVLMTTLGLAVAMMFFLRRQQAAYGWYALTILLWGFHTAHAVSGGVLFNHFFWYGLNYVSLSWLVTELYFINHYFEIRAPRLERYVLMITAGLSALLLGAATFALDSVRFESYYYTMATVASLWFMALAFVITGRYFVAVRKRWDFDSVSLWLASAVVIGVGIRDLLYEFGVPQIPGTVYYLQFVAIVPLLLFGIQLIRRFADESRKAEQLNTELQRLVASRTADLELTSRRLTKEERRRVLAEERSRLMRDMHDGLGGQLVHALALSEQGKDRDLERSLRLALDDLRLIVDSLSPSENSLQDLLASYRHRVSKMLQRSGFTVDWMLEDCATQIALKPNTALSILRIMQEAVTNAVRHSSGDHLLIKLCETDEQLQLSVTDNGCGIEAGVAERGLRNMRVRADEIGAQLDILTRSGKTEIRVSLPLDFQDVTVI
ncbi:MAG: ATP-binding protein [Pseudomonadota bacterium]